MSIGRRAFEGVPDACWRNDIARANISLRGDPSLSQSGFLKRRSSNVF